MWRVDIEWVGGHACAELVSREHETQARDPQTAVECCSLNVRHFFS